MPPADIFWAHLRKQLESHVHDIDRAERTQGLAPGPGFSAFVRASRNVDLKNARSALASAQNRSTGQHKLESSGQDEQLKELLVVDVLNCVALASCCSRVAAMVAVKEGGTSRATVDDDNYDAVASSMRCFLREVMVNNASDRITWTLALKLLLDARGEDASIAGANMLRTELGDMFSFFFEDEASRGTDEDPEERAFFVSGSVRLLEIVIECMHHCPADEAVIQKLFSCSLCEQQDDDAGDELERMTLARFLNAALDSRSIEVRALALEGVALATAKAPLALSSAAASVFSRTATSGASENDGRLREASAALLWDCIGKGGPSALIAALPEAGEVLSSVIGGVGWRKSVVVAIACLGWRGASLEARQEVSLALVLAHLRATQAFGPTSSCRIPERLSLVAARDHAVRDALVGGAVNAAELILNDSRFDLEEVLCCTAPPCELRSAVEEIGFIFQRACQTSSEAPQQFGAAAVHGMLWQQLMSATSSSLARTDQQGYGGVVVQWLLGSSSDNRHSLAFPHEDRDDPERWSVLEVDYEKNDDGVSFSTTLPRSLVNGPFEGSGDDDITADQFTLVQGDGTDHWASED